MVNAGMGVLRCPQVATLWLLGIATAMAGASFFRGVPTAAEAAAATQSLKELQERFDHEDNAVHKAKLMLKLGDAQFEALHTAEKGEDYNAVGILLEKYRDNVRLVVEGLKKQHPDAERQSNGYRQLQMQVRLGIREVEDALRGVPDEFKPPLQLVLADLKKMNDELLQLLFPRRPHAKEVTP
jgi:hypothetical protein